MLAPIDFELVDEHQAVLEHPLVHEDRALGLGGERDGDGRQVRGERGPRAVLDLARVVADIGLDDELLAARHEDVVALDLAAQAETFEGEADHAQVPGTVSLMRSSPPVMPASAMKLPISM